MEPVCSRRDRVLRCRPVHADRAAHPAADPQRAAAPAPRIRRKARPGLRRIGIRLLPPRWHLPQPHRSSRVRKAGEEIIHIHESWKMHMSAVWKKLRPWLPKIVGMVLVPIIFYRLLRPIWEKWPDLQSHLQDVRWDLLVLACLMFALNQYVCRVQLWLGVLRGLGWRMPAAPATRIWIKSELAALHPRCYLAGGRTGLPGEALRPARVGLLH